MLSFDVAGAMLLLAAFLIEAAVILLERPGRDVVKDMKANLLLGGLILLTGMVMKGVELTVFSALYSVSLFKPAVRGGYG
ncbi:MAG: hypothetical protein EOO14_13650 [Chitinophagaceae bacterium]|nr:MAG: hypothetical protein EOO14_13650 [Chitinophagaceae bacterium]